MTTFTNLNGFDMVYAVAERTINSQFKLLWALGIFPSTWTASTNGGLYAINATLGIPSVELNIGDASSHKVKLSIPLASAKLDYASISLDGNNNPVVTRSTTDVSGSTLRLTANLGLAELASSYATAGHIPAEVKAQLNAFTPSMFSMSQLFMNLEDANLLDSWEWDTNGKVNLNQPEIVGHVKDLIKAFLGGIDKDKNPYILGYSVTDKTPEASDVTWKPTGVTFSVFDDAAYPLRSSLNYLLETRGKPAPTSPLAGIFPANWVRADDVQGAFAFSQELAMGQILNAVAAAAKVSPGVFSASTPGVFTATIPNEISGNTTITVAPVAGTSSVTASFHATYSKDMHDKAGSYIGYVDGYIAWTTTVTFTVDSKNHTIAVTAANSPVQTTKDDHPNALGKFEHVLSVFADFIISVVTFGQVNDVFQNMVAGDWQTHIGTSLGTTMAGVKTRIVLPAGSQLIFKGATFTPDGTLMLTTTVQD